MGEGQRRRRCTAAESDEGVLPAAALTQTAKTRPILFDPNGGEFQLSGDKPAGFEDFALMYVQTKDDDGGRVRPNGGIIFGTTEFRLTNIVFDGRRWDFDTVAKSGVSYRFRGRFVNLRRDEHGAVVGDDVLKGRLTKLRRGQPIASADVTFSFVHYSD